MRDTRVSKKGGGFKAVVCFILGILLGIAIVAGAVAGGAMYFLNSDLDGVLSSVGVDNSKDENGKNKVINTDPEAGGAENLLGLITKVVAMASDPMNLTLGQIDDLVPATRGLVDQLSAAVEKYVEVDYETLRGIKFSGLGEYVQDVVMDIQPASFMDEFNIQGSVNTILEKVLYGLEANCVTSPSGEKFPVMVDNFVYENGAYKREEDGAALISSQEQYLIKQSADKGLFDIFFFKNSDGRYYISERDPDDIEVFLYKPDVGHEYGLYNADTYENTGNYYIDSSGEKVVMEPITIGSLVEGNGLGALEKMRVMELLSGELAQDELLETLLGDISVGDLINGNVDFQEKVNGIELGAFLSFDPFEDSMLLYFTYGLTNLSDSSDAQGRYTATYKLGEEDIPAYVKVENGKITSVTDGEGKALGGTTVGSINNTIDNIEISIFVDVTTDNGILPYLAYGITGLKQGEDGSWTAQLNGADCTVNVDGKKITSVTNTATGKPVPAAGINELSDRVNGVMDNLTIGDIIDVGDNKILKQLADYKIGNLSTAMDTLEIAGLIDIPANNKILAYLAYGITGIDGEKAMWGNEEVNLTIEDGKITAVTKANGDPVPGTTISGINGRIEGLNESVPLKDLIEIPEGNTLLEKLGDYTLANIGDAIDEIELADVIDIGVDDSGLMFYLAFGVTEITYDNAQEVYTAEKDGATVYFKTRTKDGNQYFEGMYSEPEFTTKKEGTKISKVSEQINKLTSEVQIKYLIDMSEQSSKLMEKIGEYTISNVDGVMNDLTLPDVVNIPASNKILAYLAYGITEITVDGNAGTAKLGEDTVDLTVDDSGNITAVTKGGAPVEETPVNNVGSKVDGLTSELKIKDIIDIPDGDKLMSKIGNHTINDVSGVINELTLPDVMDIPASNKILAYLAYGITEIDGTTAKLGEVTVDLTLDESGNITAVTKGGAPVEETSVNKVGEKVEGLTNDLKIRDIIDIPAGDKLMAKIGDYTINNVSKVVEVLEITDVMEVEANSVIMAYLAYGINEIDLKSNTANLGGEKVNLTVDDSGNITAVTKQDGSAVPGTKVSEMSERIEGLMNTLTIGELITIDDGNTILNAIKGATISTIGDTIDSLTLNELYADEIYKVSSYEDKDKNGQYNPEKGETMTYINAKLRKAVGGEPSDPENEIKFNANYLYYTKDENESYHLVQIEDKELGKLESLNGGEYYTYGAVQGMWTLLLTDDKGNETPLKLNGIGSVITGVAARLKGSTLNDLDKAGILDFQDVALKTSVTYQDKETTLGELTLDQALSELITMVEFYNKYKGLVGGLGG